MQFTKINDTNAIKICSKIITLFEEFAESISYDTRNMPIIGYGFNINNEEIFKRVFKKIYGEEASEEIIELLDNYKKRQKQHELSKVIKKKLKTSQEFILKKEQALELLEELLPSYCDILNKRLQKEKQIKEFENTCEFAAFMSLAYTNLKGLIRENLCNALWEKNRFKIWFEIRYNSNSGNSASIEIAKRRFAESNYFGLFDITQGEDRKITAESFYPKLFNAVEKKGTEIQEFQFLLHQAFILFQNLSSIKIDGKTYLETIIFYETQQTFNDKIIIKQEEDFCLYYKSYNELFLPFAQIIAKGFNFSSLVLDGKVSLVERIIFINSPRQLNFLNHKIQQLIKKEEDLRSVDEQENQDNSEKPFIEIYVILNSHDISCQIFSYKKAVIHFYFRDNAKIDCVDTKEYHQNVFFYLFKPIRE